MTAAPMTATAPAIDPRGALSAMLAGNLMIGMGVLAPAAMLNDLVADLAVSPPKVGLLVSYGALILCVGAFGLSDGGGSAPGCAGRRACILWLWPYRFSVRDQF